MSVDVDDLIANIANTLRRQFRLVEIEDLLQLGRCIVLEAQTKFVADQGTKFSTYVWGALKLGLTRYCIQITSPVSGDLSHANQWAREVTRVDICDVSITNADSPYGARGNQDVLLDRARAYKRVHEIIQQSYIADVMEEHLLEGSKFTSNLPRKEVTTEVTRIRNHMKSDRLLSEYCN